MRDGWRTNPVVKMPTGLHRAYSLSLEKTALAAADVVTCTAEAIADEARSLGARETVLLPNGFDPADVPAATPDPAAPLRLAYMGKVYFGHSDPTDVFEAIARIRGEGGIGSDVRMDLIGSWPLAVEDAARRLGVADAITFTSYLPHREALDIVARADAGLVLIADRPGASGSAPAKLYEYLGMGLPVLLVGPADGFPAKVLSETRGGVRIEPHDISSIAAAIRRLAEDKAAGRRLAAPDRDAVEGYGRPGQARALAELLDRLTSGVAR
jgi:glycosyltransferase involved in cell wall biosynthesis